MDDSSSMCKSDDGSEPETAGSGSGSVTNAGWSQDSSNSFSASTQFRLSLGHQANTVPGPGPATTSRFDDPMRLVCFWTYSIDASDGSSYWDGSFEGGHIEGASGAGTKAAASNPAAPPTSSSSRPSHPTQQRPSRSPPHESQPQSTPRSWCTQCIRIRTHHKLDALAGVAFDPVTLSCNNSARVLLL
ncbi:hypothetical protein M422DRAFT_254859 [Sphaerobolus stellatus SS14]|uniref:Uncharacterized protein n=1 Tax=Sphaerobolus stellatus (strain SS14) TaxID=990650 RepID=A0A0C9VKF0_SPHS4|nr:hypothetical protein M422DRAFT_254859 [Sphaerobolus stellatus SS14]